MRWDERILEITKSKDRETKLVRKKSQLLEEQVSWVGMHSAAPQPIEGSEDESQDAEDRI